MYRDNINKYENDDISTLLWLSVTVHGRWASKTVCSGQNRDRIRPSVVYILSSMCTYLVTIEKQCESAGSTKWSRNVLN